MDAFKQNEILRMQLGGNKAWQDFYNARSAEAGSKNFDESSVAERYEGDIGDEWKERLSAKVEQREFDRDSWSKERAIYNAKAAAKADPNSGVSSDQQSHGNNEDMPATQKERNEAYFARLGAANASRPDNIPPSQGGRYTGFGSSPASSSNSTSHSNPDPLAATLTRGFGWFTSSVSRTAKTVNDSYIQPTAKNIASSDFAAQARTAAIQAGTGIQTTAKSAGEGFNRFVEGGSAGHDQQSQTRQEPERKDFWDNFGQPSSTPIPTPTSGATTTGTTSRADDDRRGGGGRGGSAANQPSTNNTETGHHVYDDNKEEENNNNKIGTTAMHKSS